MNKITKKEGKDKETINKKCKKTNKKEKKRRKQERKIWKINKK